jgi:N-formylglutamate amidohydrolase
VQAALTHQSFVIASANVNWSGESTSPFRNTHFKSEGDEMTNTADEYVFHGDSPVLLLTPHTGTIVPDELLEYPVWAAVSGRLADPAGVLLQRSAKALGVSFIAARFHPCSIDLNVASDDGQLPKRLIHGSLCRTHTSRGEALYPPGSEPTEVEIERRVEAYWLPFHAAVTAEMVRLRRTHANVLLLVSHASARLSPYREQPGVSDCNVGTDSGRSCDRRLVSALTEPVSACGRTWVVNGRIADAFAAQHYGMPEKGIHVMEVEVSGRWRADMESSDGSGLESGDRTMDDLITRLQSALQSLPRLADVPEAAFSSAGAFD